MKEYIASKTDGEIELKRFYIDAKLEIDCPVCGSKCVDDIGEHYLSYPHVGKFRAREVYCDECDDFVEYQLKIKRIETVLEYKTNEEKEKTFEEMMEEDFNGERL